MFDFMVTYGEDATKPSDNSDPVVLVYDSPLPSASHSERAEFVCKLRAALANDTPTLVRGWTAQLPCCNDTFEDAVLSYFGQPGTMVTWQCKPHCQYPLVHT